MSRKEVRRRLRRLRQIVLLAALCIVLFVLVYDHAGMLAPEGTTLASLTLSAPFSSPTPAPVIPTPTPVPAVTPLPDFAPETRQEPVITSTAISVNGSPVGSFTADAAHRIDFGPGEDYTDVKGIVTFRGNNFREGAQYGSAEMNERAFGTHWMKGTDGLSDNSGNYWGGSGWTGQPLVVEWPASTRRIMNMYDWAKEKDGLVEVIYATLDGYVYFLDLESGQATRDRLFLGWSFKGAGALDPRGYPILYVGGGLFNASGSAPRILVVSLIDGEVLYSTGNDDPFAPRAGWSAFDSSALVDAETDQLIYPGENGVLYLIKLNTYYDENAGVLTMSPTENKLTYSSSTAEKYYYGMEDSAIVWRGHLFIADNGGDFLCIDLNTLQIAWRFDCLDDTNCTGVLELDDTGRPYIYLSTSFHLGWRSWDTAVIPVWKIDGVTGRAVWTREYTCYSEDGLSGGVQGSLTLGKGSLDGLLYVAMARYPNYGNGKLLALDKNTGEEVWTYQSDSYSWSTPTCFYDTQGRGYVLYTSCIQGAMYLLDGLTGQLYDSFPFHCTTEASPVVYNNTVVIGTRNNELYGITLK